MYILKVTLNQQILAVRHYKVFQNALADVADYKFAESLPKNTAETLGNPEIYCGSKDNNDIADDFEFRYNNGVCVYIGVVFTQD